MGLKTVKVPKEMEKLFAKAEKYVKKYFKKVKMDPSKGTIMVGDDRYILVRAESMSVGFLDFVKKKYPGLKDKDAREAAAKLLFDLAKSIGKADAKHLHKKMKLKTPVEKLSAGPIHFAHTGWAYVDISKESKPSPDKNFFLAYDHPNSFEADSWIKSKKKSPIPTCYMNAGYSSGWCEESFGIELTARELMCRGKKECCCSFVMAHPSKIDEAAKQQESNLKDMMRKRRQKKRKSKRKKVKKTKKRKSSKK